jgi:recombination protein RecT
MTTALDFKKPTNLNVLKNMGEVVKKSIADAMPSFMKGQAQAMLRALYTEVQKTPRLLDCTPESLFGCTIQAGQLGLMLGSALGQCYLIPFKSRATLVPGYKGYIQLVNRSGQVGLITASTVYDKDHFEVHRGSSPILIHTPGDYPTVKDVADRKPVAYYATCTGKQGSIFMSLTKPEAEYHRAQHALVKNGGPWVTHFDQMALKTCIIKLCKYLPMSVEVQTATALDESADAGEPFDASVLFQESNGDDQQAIESPKGKTAELTERLANAKPNNGKLFSDAQNLPD